VCFPTRPTRWSTDLLQGLPFKHRTHKSRLTTNVLGALSLHACCCRTSSCHFVATFFSCSTSRTHTREHFHIGTGHSGFSAPLPDILVAAKRGYPWEFPHASAAIGASYFLLWHWAPLAVVSACVRGVYIHPAKLRSSISNPSNSDVTHLLTNKHSAAHPVSFLNVYLFIHCAPLATSIALVVHLQPPSPTQPTSSIASSSCARPSITHPSQQTGKLRDSTSLALGVSGSRTSL
jgi:hypothetical protein